MRKGKTRKNCKKSESKNGSKTRNNIKRKNGKKYGGTKNKPKNNNNNKNKTKRHISLAQKQKAIKQLKNAIKTHILNIIKAAKINHKQHKQLGGEKGENNNYQGNIFMRLWKAFKRAIQKILKALGFSRKESVVDTDAISNNIEVIIFNHGETNKLTNANINAIDKEMTTTGKSTITLDEVNRISDELAEKLLHKRFPGGRFKRYSDGLKTIGNNHGSAVVNKYVVHPHPKDGKPSITL